MSVIQAVPAGVWTTNLTGLFIDPEGNPLQGEIEFVPPTVLTFPNGPAIAMSAVKVKLDAEGRFSIFLISTDNTVMSPTNWTYRVNEKIVGGSPRSYSIFLPHTPAVVDLAQIAPRSPYSGQYLPAVGPPGPPGPQGPAGPQGNPTVVNGKTGASITLTAADVGADAAGSVGAVAVAGTPTTGQVPIASGGTTAAWSDLPAPPTSLPPSGPAGGDLAGTYPNPSVARIGGVELTGGAPAAGDHLVAVSGTQADWGPAPAPNDLPLMDGPLNANGQKITSLANGTAASDAAAFGQIPVAGTAAGTYAAGNDSRFGTATQVRSVVVSATAPTAGQVLSADSGTAASWKTPAPAPVTSVNTQTGAVVLTAADVGALTQTLADGRYLQLTGGTVSGALTLGGSVAHTGAQLGFYGTAAVARPEVPAAPTVEDVVSALLALGLISQAA